MTCTARQLSWLQLALSLCALLVAGCAGLRLPRIDPTGERVFVWPQDRVPAVPLASSNLVTPPVLTDPVFPQPSPASTTPVAAVVPPLPQDRLAITPNRMLAPIGSEVVLKAGVCTAENYLLTDTKTDWLIARESAGEFVELGGRGWLQNPLLPWNKPKKIDNQFATGYSAKVPLTITRGTADVTDDVQVEPGESWATITSLVEGTSHITAVAPEVVAWSGRRATATIYWVDVQWTFPPATVSAGGSQALTTTVRRQSDGTPIEGWLVRYEVDDGTGTLTGNPSEQVVEVPTDVHGQASIDVSPTGTSGSASRINMQIVRPSRYASSDMPRLVIATGASTIHWTDASTPYLPPADDVGADPLPVSTPIPIDIVPPLAAQPVLDIEILGPSQAPVGGQARFEVVIHNRGTATATGIVVRDQFDKGLSHLKDPNGYQQIQMPLGDISPGDSRKVNPNFNVLTAGELCHTVFVTSREGAKAQEGKCLTALQPTPQKQAQINVQKMGPQQKVIGQTALFTVTVKNTGEVPLTDIQIRDEYDPALVPRPIEPDFKIVNNGIVWKIPRLEVNDLRRFDVECQCVAAKGSACTTVHVSADAGAGRGRIPSSARKCIEILPPSRDVEPPSNVVPPNPKRDPAFGNVSPRTSPQGGGLQLGLRTFADNPVSVGTFPKYEIVVLNNSAVADDRVNLRVQFPLGIVPDPATVLTNANVQANLVGNELRFDTINQIRPDERLWFTVQAKVNQLGFGDITVNVSSQTLQQPIEKTISVEAVR
ncbi:MAG: DUF11 domain-containing protein [Pirellulales bacterium]|nr:DUF11 domain-containing protein [Pirellulales bacterium]